MFERQEGHTYLPVNVAGKKMACKSCLPASKRCVSLFIISLHLTCSSGSKMIIQQVNHFKEKSHQSLLIHLHHPVQTPFHWQQRTTTGKIFKT